jgi:hypothetical protein
MVHVNAVSELSLMAIPVHVAIAAIRQVVYVAEAIVALQGASI